MANRFNPRNWPKMAQRAVLTGILTGVLAVTGIALPEPAKQAIVEVIITVAEQLQEPDDSEQLPND